MLHCFITMKAFEVSNTNLLLNSMLLALPSRGREGRGSLPSVPFAYYKIVTVSSFPFLEKKKKKKI